MNTSANDLTVGKELVSFCTRCKMDLGHTIVSMKGSAPARVICRTCKSEHNFKVKKGVKEPGSIAASKGSPKTPRVPKEPKGDKGVPVEVEWTKQMSSNSRAIKNYASNEAFNSGDRISHPSFGEGVIQKLIYPNKVEVLFRMDMKVLIHSGKPA